MAYNPVSNPNPDISPSRLPTGVQSQGYDGGIRPFMGDPNVRYSKSKSGPEHGEDQCMNNDVDMEDWA